MQDPGISIQQDDNNSQLPLQHNNNNSLILFQTGNKKVKLSSEDRKRLLIERQQIIEESLEAIQYNFFRIGKALAEIKEFKLYKADLLYKRWRDYVTHRIYPSLHQSTISDYIGIVKMQLENREFIGEEELIKLGYKKAKLLKTKFNQIQKVKDDREKNEYMERFKQVYKSSFDELKDVPYKVYEKVFNFVPSSDDRRSTQIDEYQGDEVTVRSNRRSLNITLAFEDDYKYNEILKTLKKQLNLQEVE